MHIADLTKVARSIILALLGSTQPVIFRQIKFRQIKSLFGLFMNIIAWGPQVILILVHIVMSHVSTRTPAVARYYNNASGRAFMVRLRALHIVMCLRV